MQQIVRFDVTGVDRRGIRFKKSYNATANGRFTAMNINLWSGTVWAVLSSGQRRKLKTVNN